jgi:curved DNA-binding protein
MRVEYTGDASDIFSDFFQQIFGEPLSGSGSQRQGWASLDDILGMGGRGRRGGGRDLDADIDISLDEAYHGTARMISVGGKRLQVKIPRGARTGTRVRIAGQGGEGRDGSRGDLYLNVRVMDDARFERRGDDLIVEVKIDLYMAVLGGEVQVPTLTGKVTLKINPGTQPGQLIRLRGRGMPVLREDDAHGDLFVKVNIEIPTDLSSKERAMYRELASLRGYNHER